MDKPRIGFIGLGMMGHGMAKNLLAKGFANAPRTPKSQATPIS